MSLKPGIAKDFLLKFHSDIYPNDFVVLRGKQMRPPKYYDRIYELTVPDGEYDMEMIIKSRRIEDAKKFVDNNTPDRLAVREVCTKASISKLVKSL